VETVIYSCNASLSKEEKISNNLLACRIGETLGVGVTPVVNIKDLTDKGIEKVFNLCDHDEHTGSGLHESVLELEARGIVFTGANSTVLEQFVDKKKWLTRVHGTVLTPANSFSSDSLHAPVILKNRFSHGSMKLTPESVLCRIPDTTDADSYLEEFIEGDEYSYCEVPDIFAVSIKKQVERNKICDFYYKWKRADIETCQLIHHHEIHDIAEKIKNIFGITSYFRIDYRIRNNQLFVFDVNPNCYLGENGTLMKAANLLGITFEETIEKIYT